MLAGERTTTTNDQLSETINDGDDSLDDMSHVEQYTNIHPMTGVLLNLRDLIKLVQPINGTG